MADYIPLLTSFITILIPLSERPLVALTMGDPSGIGPEIIAGSVLHPRVQAAIRPVVFGFDSIMRRAAETTRSKVDFITVDSIEDCFDQSRFATNQIPVINSTSENVEAIRFCEVDAVGGQAAYDCLIAATDCALSGKVDAIVTAPLNKEALHAAKIFYPGHTELLAERCSVDEFSMLLYLGRDDESVIESAGEDLSCVKGRYGLGVAHVTLHMALREVFQNLTIEKIVETAGLLDTFFKVIGGQCSDEKIDPPRIALAALNPHGGEAGLFGDEEKKIIEPASSLCQENGINVTGPVPTDTLLRRASGGEFDGVVAMYHDQGHIALKLLGMHRAVNVTLGLPIVRTSVAHGTAYDIAWKGNANPNSMVEAISVASKLANVRKTTQI